MEDREMPRMHKFGESKTAQIVMATVPHVTAWAGRTNYHADGFFWTECTEVVSLSMVTVRYL